jgi:hypothetical protein
MSTGQQSKFKQVLTYVLMAVYIGGICVGCLVLGGTLSEFGEIYQLQADPDVEGRSPPYDRPFVAGDSLRLVEKERFRLDFWQLEIANGGSVLIAVPNQPIGLRIYYPGYLKAVSGYWRGDTGDFCCAAFQSCMGDSSPFPQYPLCFQAVCLAAR